MKRLITDSRQVTNIPARRNAWQLYRDQRRREISDRIWTAVMTIAGFVIAAYLLKLLIEWRWR